MVEGTFSVRKSTEKSLGSAHRQAFLMSLEPMQKGGACYQEWPTYKEKYRVSMKRFWGAIKDDAGKVAISGCDDPGGDISHYQNQNEW